MKTFRRWLPGIAFALFCALVPFTGIEFAPNANAAYQPLGDVVASGTITTQNLVPAGTATASSAIEIAMGGRSAATIQVTGTYTGALSIQGTVNGTAWVTMSIASQMKNVNADTFVATIASATQSIFMLNAAGYVKIRVTALAAVTGTATVTINANANPNMMVLGSALPAGTAVVGHVVVDSGSTTAVTGTLTSAGTTTATLAASQTITPIPLATTTLCTGQHHLISAASTNATSVKNSAGILCLLQVSNINAAVRYLKIYNKASAPTVGTDTPLMTIVLPPGSNQVVPLAPFGLKFTTGIAYALTTGMAVADTGAVSAAESSVSMWYL